MIKGGGPPILGTTPEIEAEIKNGKRVFLETDNEFHHIDSFKKKYEKGLEGKNKSLNMGFKQLDRYFGLRKQVMYLVGGYTGSGKTSLVDSAFVLNPIEYVEQHPNINFHVLYFSMERSKDYKIARFISRKIFLDKGIIIPLETILGWRDIPTSAEQVIIESYFKYANDLIDKYITFFEGPIKPGGLFKQVNNFAKNRGTFEEVIIRKRDGVEYNKTIYVPTDPNELITVIVDTIQLTLPELKEDKRQTSDKETMDKMSGYLRWTRDTLGYTPIIVSQFNRDISDSQRLKAGDVSPRLEDFMGSSNMCADSEVILALFDCTRYKVEDVNKYALNKLRETEKNKNPGSLKYRSIFILKNSYGAENISKGLAYQPETGILCEMPRRDETTDEVYDSILNNNFFLK